MYKPTRYVSSIYNVLHRKVQQAIPRTYLVSGVHYAADRTPRPPHEQEPQIFDICEESPAPEPEMNPDPSSAYFYLFSLAFGALVLPFPNFICGFLLGAVSVGFIGLLVISFAAKIVVGNIEESFFREKMQKNRRFPPKQPPSSTAPLQEWLNLQTSENKSRTVVFGEFCDDLLVVSYPKQNIDPHNVRTDMRTAEFIQRRKVSVSAAKIYLLPANLSTKKLWSKKHPLCVDTSPGTVFYLFFTSQRSKEVWYRRLSSAVGSAFFPAASLVDESKGHSGIPVYESDNVSTQEETAGRLADLYNFVFEKASEQSKTELEWLNVLLRRLSYHVCTSLFWRERLSRKVEHKFKNMDLPSVIDGISVNSIEIGASFPEILRLERPRVDSMGVWLDVGLVYGGGFRIQLQTKVDLLRLAQDNPKSGDCRYARDSKMQGVIKKVTSSSYFKRALEFSLVKNSVENIANTPLLLDVEVTGLEGTMTLNLPNPPTDRIWFGFRGSPSLHLVVKPKVGDRNINELLCKLVKRILLTEFEREAVLPNMVDVIVPFFVTPHVLVGNI